MEEKILTVLRAVLGNATLDSTCCQENCEDWDSLRHLTVCFELEEAFDVQFEPEEMEAMKSYNDIVHILETKK